TSAAAYGSLLSQGRRWERACIRDLAARFRPSDANSLPPSQKRGRRECRMRAAPAVSYAKVRKNGAHEHTGSAEAVRHPLRNGFTAYIALSPVERACCHRRRRDTSRQLSASIAAPGPHDFAVRLGVFVRCDHSHLTPKRPSHPAPHVS